MLRVTKTHLPDISNFKNYIDNIFESGWITNNGQYVKELKNRLEKYLGVKNLLLVTNGTIALQIAYKLLDLKGEVITTPFSFVATTSSLIWEGLKPVFVDIDKDTFCIDYKRIEEKITEETTAIVPVHVFGNGCEVEEIERIAKKYNLKVIYDAAHAFGINYKGQSILNFGDVSVLSFHATKVFHTIEGGALVINDDKLFEKAQRMINFGITGPESINGLGINAKMSEFQAAMGLCLLDEIDQSIENRRIAYESYMSKLNKIQGIAFQRHNENCNCNYGYMPVLFRDEETLLKVKERLEANDIYPRRYFYPSLDTLEYVESDYMENSNDVSKRILCLPMSDYLSKDDICKIVSLVCID